MKNKIIDFCLSADKILMVLLSLFLPFAAIAWIYSVAYYFNSRLPIEQQANSKRFLLYALSPAICMVLIFVVMILFSILMAITENPIWMVLMWVLMFPIYFLLLAGAIAMIYYSAKIFRLFELTKRPPSQSDVIFFVVFWLNFIAIIMYQDDINMWYSEAPVVEKPNRHHTPNRIEDSKSQ